MSGDNGKPYERGLLDPLEMLAEIAVSEFVKMLYPLLCHDCQLAIPTKIRRDMEEEKPMKEEAS